MPYEDRTVKRHVFGMSTLRGLVALLALAAAGVAAPGKAEAQAKPKVTRACGVSSLPLSLGNSWTYDAVGAPIERQLSEGQARNSPKQPLKVNIQVTAVETQGDTTVVTLTETVDGRAIKTSIRCSATKFEIDPNSFFFAGEPGGAFNVNFTSYESKGNTWELKGGRITGPEWRNDVLASWERIPTKDTGAKLGKGKLEMERRFIVGGEVNLMTNSGQYVAREVNIEITGRITLDPPAEKPYELPANFKSTLWFADGVGVVQVINGFAHMYLLSAKTINK